MAGLFLDNGVRLQRCLRLLARVDLRFRNLP
nr:MAG TPA: hypothetical protein [Caudoviricetes sp.]